MYNEIRGCGKVEDVNSYINGVFKNGLVCYTECMVY